MKREVGCYRRVSSHDGLARRRRRSVYINWAIFVSWPVILRSFYIAATLDLNFSPLVPASVVA